ncbi:MULTISPECIES: hypothetical protein [Natronorubrum]|uniref:Uncharacterized protein n=1 Tax=Natronorubrum daqingense TaxID=588898 RepID=A0A1P8REJ0_9EURY|nr:MULTISPECIES: hypothetical protein [Natronorubrum]APX97076.1 hypothetical protein BB347_10825 [Natronorubrum daqingense]
MSLDKHAAERRRFARLLGTDGELGCGLPIGTHSSRHAGDDADRDHPPKRTAPSSDSSGE